MFALYTVPCRVVEPLKRSIDEMYVCLIVQLVVTWFSRAVSRGVSEDHTILEATRHLPDALWPELRCLDEGGRRRCPDLSRVLDPLCKRLCGPESCGGTASTPKLMKLEE